ncbi:molybdate ABC transporter substrate-binding protein [Nioella aestuarii]|uniref:molybdate ABC transporter substrate-binding protein n=1 Tax=Nioella aestuarii TaxID=1662864 RepID=UPI003D7F7E2B
MAMLFAQTPARAETITVFAAASLTTAMTQIAQRYEAISEDEIVLSFAGSSALARQIQLGAPADIFISASPDWMNLLQISDLIDPDSRRDLLANSLVLIAHGEADPVDLGPDLDLAALLGSNRLAMALTEAVPAGIYGRAALETLGLWDQVSAQVAETDNVRAALALVALGEAPLGIVYATDARAEPDVSVIAAFPPDSHPPITYPVAQLYGPAWAQAGDFLTFLQSPDAREVFEAEGFTVLGD